MPVTTPEINKMIAALPSREELTPEQRKQEDIAALNDYALRNPNKVFNDDFKEQRKHLTEETWKAVIQANPDMQDSASDKWRKIPNSNIVNKYQGQAFSGKVREAINEDGVKLAGLAAAVPGAIIGGTTLAQPILSQMVYQPGTFLAETVGGTVGGLAGGAATDAITRGVSDYNSFANMIASNSTITEQYAEMLNPGMLLGGVGGALSGSRLYNAVKPTIYKQANNILNYLKNNVSYKIPKAKYYRTVSDLSDDFADDAISDLLNTRVIRANPKGTKFEGKNKREKFIGPYFSKGKPYRPINDYSSKLITSNSDNLTWLEINPHQIDLQEHIGSNQFTPLHNGKPNQAPISEFDVWERGNNFLTKHFWFKKELPKITQPTQSKLTELERLGIPKGERKQYLTGNNADPSYYSAIGLNNTKYTQALRDLHFQLKTNQSPVTVSHHSKTPFTIFNKSKFGLTDDGFNGKGFYFGETYNYGKPNEVIQKPSARFPEVRLGPHGERFYHNYGPIKRYFYLKGDYVPTAASADFFNQKNHLIGITDGTAKEYVVGHPEQIKLADYVTFDDQGQIIPLSKRDNFSNPDIRYKQGGTINYLNLFK